MSERGRWYNDTPITDIHEALGILNVQSPLLNEVVRLARRWADGIVTWEIVVPWYTHGDSGGERAGENYFQIDTALAQRLVDEKMVTPYIEARWGYSETHRDRLVITKHGKDALKIFEEHALATAVALLTPGIHTDLVGEPVIAHIRREEWRTGHYYIEFRMPDERRCRVYPDIGMLIVQS